MSFLGKVLIALLVAFVGAGIVWKATDYLHPDFSQGFLLGKAELFPFYGIGLYLHAVGAPLALFLGLGQWLGPKRGRRHRVLGRAYAILVLSMAVPGAYLLAPWALGGWPSILCFGILTTAWALTTLAGWRAARRQQGAAHSRWMLHSFALCCSAVLLRLLMFAFTSLSLPPLSSYPWAAWLSWVPLSLALELWWRGQSRKNTPG